MEIRATVRNGGREHSVTVSTDGRRSSLPVPPKAEGAGSSVNGGELLCLYAARVSSDAPEAEIEALLRHTDQVAEVQNTLRAGVAVELRGALPRSAGA